MAFDLILRNARVAGEEDRVVDIGISGGRFAAIEAGLGGEGPEQDLGGRLVVPGFVETHIHLDKSCILDRCASDGTLAAALAGEIGRETVGNPAPKCTTQ